MAAFTLSGTNLFAYCMNNPVSSKDENGEWVHLVVGAVVGAAIGCISSIMSDGDFVDVMIGVACGAASGLLAASGVGAIGQVVCSSAIAMTCNAGQQINSIRKKEQTSFNYSDMIVDGVVGGICGKLGGSGASYGNTGGIKAAGSKLVKNFFSKKAWTYYSTQAHKQGGQYVFSALGKSLRIGAWGSAFTTAKNWAVKLWKK